MSETSTQKLANPAVVGLAGFAVATSFMQIHNLVGGFDLGLIVTLGIIAGGLMQFLAGFMEFRAGNTFGFCAFSGYGSFWMSVGFYILLGFLKVLDLSLVALGWYGLVWSFFSLLLLIPSLYIHKTMAFTIAFLVFGLGFGGIADLFDNAGLSFASSIFLLLASLAAFYMMLDGLLSSVSDGKTRLPLGAPFVKVKR